MLVFFVLCVTASLSQFQFGPNVFSPEAAAARDLVLKTYAALLNLQNRSCPRCIVKLNKELIDLDDEDEPLDFQVPIVNIICFAELPKNYFNMLTLFVNLMHENIKKNSISFRNLELYNFNLVSFRIVQCISKFCSRDCLRTPQL